MKDLVRNESEEDENEAIDSLCAGLSDVIRNSE